jgi:uncharacterized membrane protein
VDRKAAIITVYTLSWVGIVCMLGAVGLAPLLKVRHPQLSGFFYILFAPFCHQIPSRCFRLAGFPMAVCARCLGVYAGFAAGLIIYPFRRGFREVRLPSVRTFLLISIPVAVDVAGTVVRLWDSSPWLRFGLAVVWGTMLPLYFITGLVDAWSQVRQRGKRRSGLKSDLHSS